MCKKRKQFQNVGIYIYIYILYYPGLICVGPSVTLRVIRRPLTF